MSARVGDAKPPGVAGPAGRPGIGRAAVRIVQQHGVQHFQGGEINEREGAGVDPTARDLGHRDLKPAYGLRQAGVFAVRRHTDLAQVDAAIRQVQLLDHLALGHFDHTDGRRYVRYVRTAPGQMVGHEQKAAIPSQGGGYRLARHLNAGLLLAPAQVEQRDRVVEAVADEECLRVEA